MEIDYTKWQVGVALSDKIVLVACPVCTKPCHAKVGSKGAKYIHSARIERVYPSKESIEKKKEDLRDPDNRFQLSTPEPKVEARNKVVPLAFCKHTQSQRLSLESSERFRKEREAAKAAGARA